MCIIVAKRKGIELPTKEILKNCFNYNSDGAGIMFNDGNQVFIEKGFMDFNSFYSRLEALDKEFNLVNSDLALHFRISTSGNVDQGNCHPYPISTETDQLRNLSLVTDIGMAHNGVIRKHIPETRSILNDTQTFIKNFVYNMYSSNKEFLTVDANIKALEEEAGSKLCFITKDNMYIIGKFIEETNGILYSNDTYLSYDYGWGYEDYSVDFDYFDMFDIEGEPLDVKDFTFILSKLEFVKEDTVKCFDGTVYYNENDLVVDKYGNLFELDYNKLSFNFLGELDFLEEIYI